jgi:hypothetical protein
MGLLDIFRKPPPIRDLQAVGEFIDTNAAMLIQKGIYEYSRARSGHYAKVLFSEPEFLQAVDRSRWQMYPLGLAMVAEIVEGIMTSPDPQVRQDNLAALSDVVLAIFDRYPVPAALGEYAWADARAELVNRLQMIGLHPPKWAKDVAAPFQERYFAAMPIYEKLRKPDYPAISNYLKVMLCNIHAEFENRLDRAALPDLLHAAPA